MKAVVSIDLSNDKQLDEAYKKYSEAKMELIRLLGPDGLYLEKDAASGADATDQ